MKRYILDGAYFETTREGGKSRNNVILTQPLRGWTPRPRNLPHVLPSVRSKQKQSCRPELTLMPCRAGTLGTSLGWSGYERRIDTARSKSKPPIPYSRRLREETRAQPTKRGSSGLMFSTSDESLPASDIISNGTYAVEFATVPQSVPGRLVLDLFVFRSRACRHMILRQDR